MAHPLFNPDEVHCAQLDELCPVKTKAVVSKPLLNTDALKQVLFAMDAGQELSEHRAPFLATVHVLDGQLQFTAAGQSFTLKRHDWMMLPADAPHALVAEQPTRFLLTLAKESLA